MDTFYKFLLFASVCVLSSAKDCGHPNKTETAVHDYSCDPTLPTQTSSFQITNKAGKVVYPTNIYEVYVHQTIENKGVQYDKLLVDVSIAEYTTTLITPSCHWWKLPTFGMTKNLDWCEQSGGCPLKVGTSNLVYYMDFTKYKPIIDLLKTKYSYELRFALHTPAKEHVGCLAVQTMIVKK